MPYEDYIKLIDQEFNELFSEEKMRLPHFQQILSERIVHCFHIQSKGFAKERKTELILNQLFSQFALQSTPSYSFDFSEFIDRYITKKSEKKSFLTALIYGLYYEDINLKDYKNSNCVENLEFLLLQIAAENVGRRSLANILTRLPLHKLLYLICFAFLHYREGSFFILSLLEEIHDQTEGSKKINELIHHLRKRYFDKKLLLELLIKSGTDECSLDGIITELQKHADEQTQVFFQRFNELIPLIIEYPVRLYNDLENLKINLGGFAYQPTPQGMEKAMERKKALQHYFQSFFEQSFSFKNFHDFVQYIGIEGHRAKLRYQNKYLVEENTLPAVVSQLCEVFSNSSILMNLNKSEITDYIHYAKTIVEHLVAMNASLFKYRIELKKWACAIATQGKELERLPTLPSVVRGLSTLVKLLNSKLSEKTNLKHYPFLIFDQSDPELFLKNKRYIARLNRRYKSAILHLSKEETLSIAKKIGVDRLIDTTGTGIFGYGGARNCIYLLTAVIKHAYILGKTTVSQILEMDPKILMGLFREKVLGNELYPGDSITMIDDDKEVPEATIFTQILYSIQHSTNYSALIGYQYGRNTFQNFFFRLENLPYPSFYKMLFRKFDQSVIPSSFSDYCGKPRICINLPMGSEEAYFIKYLEHTFLMQPTIHMPYRNVVPKDQIPTYWFVGIQERLKKSNPYYLQNYIIDNLIEADKMLPWNDPYPANQFTCLYDIFRFIADDGNTRNLQKKFWEIINLFINTDQMNKNSLHNRIRYLIDLDVDSVVGAMVFKVKLTPPEKKAIEDITAIFTFFKKDAQLFWEFSLLVIHHIQSALSPSGKTSEHWYEACVDQNLNLTEIIDRSKISIESKHAIKLRDYPITMGLYRVFLAVGAAEFCKEIGKVLTTIGQISKVQQPPP